MMLMPLSPTPSWARGGWLAAVRRALPPLGPTTGLLLAALACLLVAPDFAHAQAASGNLSLNKILPSSLIDKPFLVKVITVLIMMAIAGGVVMIGFGVMGGVGDVFPAVSDGPSPRRMGGVYQKRGVHHRRVGGRRRADGLGDRVDR